LVDADWCKSGNPAVSACSFATFSTVLPSVHLHQLKPTSSPRQRRRLRLARRLKESPFHDVHLENERDARRKECADVQNADADRIRTRTLFFECYVPADGTTAATVGNGNVGASPFFGQLWGKSLLACLHM
jgi:hypothetical protein